MGIGRLHGIRVAFVATDGVEERELSEVWQGVVAGGGEPHLLSNRLEPIQALIDLDKTRTFEVDRRVEPGMAAEYDALVIPGGVKSPDKLRTDPATVEFVRAMCEAGRPIAAICHGPALLIEAGSVAGRTLTSYPSLRTDIRNAGGYWVDEEVRVDGVLVTSRRPPDIPAFIEALVTTFEAAVAVPTA